MAGLCFLLSPKPFLVWVSQKFYILHSVLCIFFIRTYTNKWVSGTSCAEGPSKSLTNNNNKNTTNNKNNDTDDNDNNSNSNNNKNTKK